ncbi:MAG TPA: hydroxymyristoyl-ACP dehydratase, partial [Gammaproteobacteria bacterium]|nr:hydroxymyristoyl-ACP dehydratase [Gammaproteobacteria bacterium]
MRIPVAHPALPGHFPGHPVVPGVVLLDAVVAALTGHAGGPVRVTGFPNIKFLAPLRPEREFEVTFAVKRPGQAAFDVLADGTKLASGSIAYE